MDAAKYDRAREHFLSLRELNEPERDAAIRSLRSRDETLADFVPVLNLTSRMLIWNSDLSFFLKKLGNSNVAI